MFDEVARRAQILLIASDHHSAAGLRTYTGLQILSLDQEIARLHVRGRSGRKDNE